MPQERKERWEHGNLHLESPIFSCALAQDPPSSLTSLELLTTQDEAEQSPDRCLTQLLICGLWRKAERNSLGSRAIASLLLAAKGPDH